MTTRKFLFWLHLSAGAMAGLVILIMSITGVLLMYERQIVAWADRGYWNTPPPGATRLPVETLLANAREAEGAAPVVLSVHAAPDAPAQVGFENGRSVFVNPYQGTVLGEGSQPVRKFFRTVTDVHRWLGASGENRPTGKAITGASNLAFLFLVLSGLFIWFPRKLAWNRFRPVLLFRRGVSGKTRDFNWHNVIGFWCAIPLFFVVIGASVISYPWATNLVYRVTGTEPPAPAATPAKSPGAPKTAPSFALDGSLNRAWSRAEKEIAGWQTILLRAPATPDAPLSFAVDESHRGRPDLKNLVVVDPRTAEVVRTEYFQSYNRGRQVRLWLRWIHTGEALGLPGQTIAGIASLGAAFLVWTGLALAWRRFRAWLSARSRAVEPSESREEVLVRR